MANSTVTPSDATVRAMTNEAERPALSRLAADGDASLGRRATTPFVLTGDGVSCRVRTLPFRPDSDHLVLLQRRCLPTDDDLARWIDDLAGRGYRRVRTGALGTTASLRVEAAGFTLVQQLMLLQHDDPRRTARARPRADRRPQVATHRLNPHHHDVASVVDVAAFGEQWGLDAAAVADVRRATPRHRARLARAGDAHLAAYAITGRDANQGFLQRLAVDPDHQRRGLGRALVLDSLKWLGRWRVGRVLVNTPTDNEAALCLYEQVGFRRLPERLGVYERILP